MVIWMLPLTNGEIDKVQKEITQTPLKKDILKILLDQLESATNHAKAYSKEQLIEIFGIAWSSLPEWYQCDKLVVKCAVQNELKVM